MLLCVSYCLSVWKLLVSRWDMVSFFSLHLPSSYAFYNFDNSLFVWYSNYKKNIFWGIFHNVYTISCICQEVGSLWAHVQSVGWLISTSKLNEHISHTKPHNTEHNTPVNSYTAHSMSETKLTVYIHLADWHVPEVEESGFRSAQEAFDPHIKVPFPFLVILVL